jgi:hypothetical protein
VILIFPGHPTIQGLDGLLSVFAVQPGSLKITVFKKLHEIDCSREIPGKIKKEAEKPAKTQNQPGFRFRRHGGVSASAAESISKKQNPMKNPIIKTLALCALLGSTTSVQADTTLFVKASAPWQGYMNVFELPTEFGPGAYVFGAAWGVQDLRAVFSGSKLTLSPNTIGDPNVFWYQNTSGLATPPNVGGPGQLGNKTMDASLYVQVPDGSLSGQSITFTGNVASNNLSPDYTTVAFIKDFAPDYSSFNAVTADLVNGTFSITLVADIDPARHIQYGFQTVGRNVWVTDVGPLGAVQIDTLTVPPGNPNVKVDPAAAWQGYLNIFNLPGAGGAFVSGSTWPTKDLAAVFSGPTLTLKPNSIDDPSYYDDGVGNKNMEANMYVETLPGTLSGQTVNFSGTVSANTLAVGYTAIAFIKDFAPDYSTVEISTVPLTAGPFTVSRTTIANSQRHIQYGFQVFGPPVPIENVGSFGSIEISTDLTNSYATWLSGFDFSSFSSPNLTQSGDPDGDGLNNFSEFALNSNPTNPASSGKVSSAVGTVGADNAMLLTLPVFNGASFSGSPSETATIGQLNYTVEGSNNLALFDQPVSEVLPAQSEGLPVTGAGWSYRTFRLDGAVGGVAPRGPAGFLRARTSSAP